MKKVVFPGLVAGLLMLIVGTAFAFLFNMIPSIAAEYQSEFFRSWNDSLMYLFYSYPFVLGIVLAWFWDKSKKLFKGTTFQKALKFGLAYFLILIPGMLISYSSFKISLLMTLTWLFTGFVNSVVAGLIFAKINK